VRFLRMACGNGRYRDYFLRGLVLGVGLCVCVCVRSGSSVVRGSIGRAWMGACRCLVGVNTALCKF